MDNYFFAKLLFPLPADGQDRSSGKGKRPLTTPRKENTPSTPREPLHERLPYSAKVRSSRDPVSFIGRHKHVNEVAQKQIQQTPYK